MNLQISKTDNPTKHQLQAIDFLNSFISSKERLALLKGYAGTGKTYILKHFLSHYYKGNCCVTAPTHKAVRVIESVLNRKGKTLQSLLGLRLNTDLENFDIASPQFDPLGEDHIKYYNLIIIDEGSMINPGLDNLIRLKSQQHNVKVLIVGDFCQLPPIKCIISPTSNITNNFELTEIIRQKESNPLLNLLDLIRNDIIFGTNTFHPFLIKERSNILNHEGYILLNDIDFKTAILKYYKHERFFKNVDFIRSVAWTNNCVSKWNKFIRDNIFDNPKEILHDKDLLTSYTTIVDEFNSPIIINSEDYLISTLRGYTDSVGITNYGVNLLNVINHNEDGIISGLETSTIKIVNPHNKQGFTKFYNTLSTLHQRAINSNPTNRKMNWRNYYNFKNDHLCMFSFKLGNNNDNAFVKKDLDYGYALTVHKSQGSTYDNIAIDLEDIMFNRSEYAPNKLLRDKLIYVALSRAKNIAIIKL
jgi:hypothetical protein